MNDIQYAVHPGLGLECSSEGMIHLPTSTNGRWKDRWVKGTLGPLGYYVFRFKGKTHFVHRIIAEAFLHGEGQVDHINRIKSDNRLVNLRFVSRSENAKNTDRFDVLEKESRCHFCDDQTQYFRDYAAKNRGKIKSYRHHYYLTHKEHAPCQE